MNSEAGKGDDPRPTKKKIFDTNFDDINMKHKPTAEIQVVKIKGKIVTRYIYK